MAPLGDSHRSKEGPKTIFRLRGQGGRIISVKMHRATDGRVGLESKGKLIFFRSFCAMHTLHERWL
jgi:hypothetical protein